MSETLLRDSGHEITRFKTSADDWKNVSEQRIGMEDRDSQSGKKVHTMLGIVYGRSTNPPGTHTSKAIGECEIRQLRRWQWARVPPAATPTRIYLIFPFYLFGLPLVEDHSSNPHSSVAIIGEHGGPPPAMARRPSFSLAGYYSSSADAWCASCLRARHRCKCFQKCNDAPVWQP